MAERFLLKFTMTKALELWLAKNQQFLNDSSEHGSDLLLGITKTRFSQKFTAPCQFFLIYTVSIHHCTFSYRKCQYYLKNDPSKNFTLLKKKTSKKVS